MSRFNECLPLILAEEGGYSNHKSDPGGPTMQGITQAVYNDYREAGGLPACDVRGIKRVELKAIYRKRYWDLIHGDQLPAGVDLVVFDGAVNSGPGRSARWLQRALNDLRGTTTKIGIDGVIGPQTRLAIMSCDDHDALINRICDRRLAMLRRLKTWRVFKTGWTKRVEHMRANGIHAATASPEHVSGGATIAAKPTEGANAKAFATDIKKAPSVAPADAALGAGAVTAALSQAQDQLAPYTSIDAVNKISAVLAGIGVAVMLGALTYRIWAKRRAAANADALEMA